MTTTLLMEKYITVLYTVTVFFDLRRAYVIVISKLQSHNYSIYNYIYIFVGNDETERIICVKQSRRFKPFGKKILGVLNKLLCWQSCPMRFF